MFAPDAKAVYDYTRLDDEQKTELLESLGDGEKIDRNSIKALSYGHKESRHHTV